METITLSEMKKIYKRVAKVKSCKTLDLAVEYIEESFDGGYVLSFEGASAIIDFVTFVTERPEFEGEPEAEQEE